MSISIDAVLPDLARVVQVQERMAPFWRVGGVHVRRHSDHFTAKGIVYCDREDADVATDLAQLESLPVLRVTQNNGWHMMQVQLRKRRLVPVDAGAEDAVFVSLGQKGAVQLKLTVDLDLPDLARVHDIMRELRGFWQSGMLAMHPSEGGWCLSGTLECCRMADETVETAFARLHEEGDNKTYDRSNPARRKRWLSVYAKRMRAEPIQHVPA